MITPRRIAGNKHLTKGVWRSKCGSRACVGAGLPAIQAPRFFSCTEEMLSQASQLPHSQLPHF
ncbi:hypothetical protein PspR76_05935 [Pseudomonas sp. R76]|nr:hypothetical protein PspR76_05935 [Pseudomonas sp. R76]